ncbi:hypothetical protein FNB79_15925 [Formosa sediminum]|uniref:Uncharacterized protein n=1 Tax=Formosa sediminum TaxID=2594004 RepID=A0A516GV51_9FLAO|nr:hypothetical protein [Formosa sediminum]QDO95392.1 hypothetical protein FNB79_15925 [Formosa sediminum]
MKAATVKELKVELKDQTQAELIEICLRLSKFKKENKELLTYILFESYDESEYINQIKTEVTDQFKAINTNSFFYIKKSVRKILKQIKTYARYSGKKETEVELLLFFCSELKALRPSIKHNVILTNLYNRQIISIKKSISTFHEDLQYDYLQELNQL